MSKKLLAAAFVLSLSLNAAFLIYLIAGGTRSTPAETGKPQPVLTLSSEQLKQMEPARAKLHLENEAIKKEISQYHEKLLAALGRDPADKETAFNCVDKINELQKKIQQNTIEEIILVRQYMNPDQCRCLMKNLGTSLDRSAKPCSCPHCQPQKK